MNFFSSFIQKSSALLQTAQEKVQKNVDLQNISSTLVDKLRDIRDKLDESIQLEERNLIPRKRDHSESSRIPPKRRRVDGNGGAMKADDVKMKVDVDVVEKESDGDRQILFAKSAMKRHSNCRKSLSNEFEAIDPKRDCRSPAERSDVMEVEGDIEVIEPTEEEIQNISIDLQNVDDEGNLSGDSGVCETEEVKGKRGGCSVDCQFAGCGESLRMFQPLNLLHHSMGHSGKNSHLFHCDQCDFSAHDHFEVKKHSQRKHKKYSAKAFSDYTNRLSRLHHIALQCFPEYEPELQKAEQQTEEKITRFISLFEESLQNVRDSK